MSRIIEKIDAADEWITLDDGFLYYDPRPCLGALSAANLREIADELDRRNAAWAKQIDDYFANQDSSTNG